MPAMVAQNISKRFTNNPMKMKEEIHGGTWHNQLILTYSDSDISQMWLM